MSWLRIDDSFDAHPKIVGLRTDERRWTWNRILIYTCRYRSDIIPSGIRDVVTKASAAFLKDCIALRLIDVVDGVMHVHDWHLYNADTIEEKVAAYLSRHPDASANEVYREIGGKREVVLGLVASLRPGSLTVPPGSQNGSHDGSESGSRARGPDPDPSFKELPPNPPAGGEPDARLKAWRDYAASVPGARSVEALAQHGYRQGGLPPTNDQPKENRADPSTVLECCDEKLGHGHADNCPRMPSTLEPWTQPEVAA